MYRDRNALRENVRRDQKGNARREKKADVCREKKEDVSREKKCDKEKMSGIACLGVDQTQVSKRWGSIRPNFSESGAMPVLGLRLV